MNKKRTCGVFLIILVGGMLASVPILMWAVNREISTPLETRNATGTTGYMLIVYRPGLSTFPTDIVNKFAEGAISKNWALDLSTVSPISPQNISKYNLIVLLSPIYGGKIQSAVATYLSTVDLLLKPVVTILTCGGINATDGTCSGMGDFLQQIAAAHGVNLIQASYQSDPDTAQEFSDAYQLGANQLLIDAI